GDGHIGGVRYRSCEGRDSSCGPSHRRVGAISIIASSRTGETRGVIVGRECVSKGGKSAAVGNRVSQRCASRGSACAAGACRSISPPEYRGERCGGRRERHL